MIPYVLGHLACSFKEGMIPAGHGMPKVDLGQYLTLEQRKRYIKDGRSPAGMMRMVV